MHYARSVQQRWQGVVRLVKRLGEFSRHPLVVGGGLAVLTALFASILVPALTRVWQDRPKELALKRSLVELISKSSTKAIDEATFSLVPAGDVKRANRVFNQQSKRWQVDSSIVLAELTTYFHRSAIQSEWSDYVDAVQAYEYSSAFWGVAQTPDEDALLKRFFKSEDFLPSEKVAAFRRLISGSHHDRYNALYYQAPLLPRAVRDRLASRVVEMPASGFSHGFWVFR